jgi:hypothetical protein
MTVRLVVRAATDFFMVETPVASNDRDVRA